MRRVMSTIPADRSALRGDAFAQAPAPTQPAKPSAPAAPSSRSSSSR